MKKAIIKRAPLIFSVSGGPRGVSSRRTIFIFEICPLFLNLAGYFAGFSRNPTRWLDSEIHFSHTFYSSIIRRWKLDVGIEGESDPGNRSRASRENLVISQRRDLPSLFSRIRSASAINPDRLLASREYRLFGVALAYSQMREITRERGKAAGKPGRLIRFRRRR
jgi:hypothetical protein